MPNFAGKYYLSHKCGPSLVVVFYLLHQSKRKVKCIDGVLAEGVLMIIVNLLIT